MPRFPSLVLLMIAAFLSACASKGPSKPDASRADPAAGKKPVVTGDVLPRPRPFRQERAAPRAYEDAVIASAGGNFFRLVPRDFSDLDGWGRDLHGETLPAFREVCDKLMARDPGAPVGGAEMGGFDIGGEVADWAPACADLARTGPRDARAFFERHFAPVKVELEPGEQALFTAYYEPELRGSRRYTSRYRYPLYAKPDDLRSGRKYLSRAEIDRGALRNKGLELFYVDDPVDLFFLHIQGSGRVRLDDGTVARVGYAGKNGHAYRSIGKVLANWGEMDIGQASADGIKDWVRANPRRMWELFATNPSYVFFTERPVLEPWHGPVGAFGTPLPGMRAIALDKSVYPLGAPVWIATDSPLGPLHRLTIALDVGGAIKGPQRADVFFGSGDQAGEAAGRMKHYGEMTLLLPLRAHDRLFRAGA